MRFDLTQLDGFSVADALDRFGVRHSRSRAACPICAGSNPQAFAFGGPSGGRLFQCFSCHASGNAITLYAKLAGVSVPVAIEHIAAILGITEVDPTELARIRSTRAQEAEAKRMRDDARSQGLTRLATWAQEDERLARIHLEMSRGWGATAVAVEHVTEHYRLLRRVRHWDTLSDTAQSVS